MQYTYSTFQVRAFTPSSQISSRHNIHLLLDGFIMFVNPQCVAFLVANGDLRVYLINLWNDQRILQLLVTEACNIFLANMLVHFR